ncbi:hypothetical protein LY11_02375 [Pedobacter cryoconitis]|uniref:Uncharacterized protein n=1 Tax=Pedobacter cryoconitis TaxID=188932 RepID=A0A327STQ0_9SPHI|nr:hypothetical protein LY11_02375 [Pedobacter cryoconitis]
MVLNVIYYYYYLIYTKIIPDNEPHATVIFTLSVSEMMILNLLLEIYLIKSHCISLPIWISVALLVLILLFNIFYYRISKKGEAIVKNQPKLLKSNALSIVVTGLIFIIAIACMIFGSNYTHDLLNECKFGVN